MPEPIDPERFFLEIQQGIADLLDADAYFDGIPILTARLGDLESSIEMVMSKLGICVVIQSPVANIRTPNVGAVNFDDIPITLTIWEDTTLNRAVDADGNVKRFTGTTLVALWLLTHARPRNAANETISNALHADNPTLVNLESTIDKETFPNIHGFQIRLKTSAGFNYVPQQTLLSENNEALLAENGIKLTTDRSFQK